MGKTGLLGNGPVAEVEVVESAEEGVFLLAGLITGARNETDFTPLSSFAPAGFPTTFEAATEAPACQIEKGNESNISKVL
ncbi:unnamed protein product [Protopolystoma xenopodis]|uniref:Uncharacterized protein n=1 Tax=Protopolystoma xenopodis TaxID=117903 RepID=A0A3S5AXD1_9PLAT|nr:unnamed protein product [Protopolystoma xenopodis]